jgi:UDP-N-acetylmuramyl pentapeptide phosphotransferase/UDP-N-acetylglucosamine-1-phosphate transferase
LIGILDDSHSFTPIKKMILQSLITGIVLLLLYFESETNVSYLLLPFLFIGLIFQTNSLNIIDHYNGLSTLTYLYSILFMNYFYPEKILLPNSTPTILLFLTFLYFNLREKGKAKIFQGNGGSHFFGGLLSIIFVKILLETKDLYNFLAVLSTGFVIFFPSLLDTLQVIFSRIGLKLNPLKGSNHHISHRIDIYTSNSVFKTIGIITTIILLPVTIFFYLDFNSSRLVSILFMVTILFIMTIWFASKNIKENISGDK